MRFYFSIGSLLSFVNFWLKWFTSNFVSRWMDRYEKYLTLECKASHVKEFCSWNVMSPQPWQKILWQGILRGTPPLKQEKLKWMSHLLSLKRFLSKAHTWLWKSVTMQQTCFLLILCLPPRWMKIDVSMATDYREGSLRLHDYSLEVPSVTLFSLPQPFCWEFTIMCFDRSRMVVLAEILKGNIRSL